MDTRIMDVGPTPTFRVRQLIINGEIYNHKALAKKLNSPLKTKPKSDCEIILHLYREYGTDLCNMLDGMFSFILLDTTQTPPRLIVARDTIGITTLYYGTSSSHPETMYIASELKSIHKDCDSVHAFPPGHFYDSSLPAASRFTRYYNPDWLHADIDAGLLSRTQPVDLTLIRTTLEGAVRKRLMSEVPFGVLLSGGLDSSLIAAIATREIQRINDAYAVQIGKGSQPLALDNQAISYGLNLDGSLASSLPGVEDELTVDSESSLASWPRLHSFSIGLKDAPDLIAARQAADFLHTLHHEFTFTVREGLDAIPDVIYQLETYDVTTVRASTLMYLLSRKIKATGVKMVLSGEGSDEILGGYLYFSQAPDQLSFYQETIKRARVPFLDKEFLSLCLNIRPEDKMFGKGVQQTTDQDGKPIMEKYILRKAFDCSPDGKPYLPDSILWRQKEQFSDGVGYSWIDGLKEHADQLIIDE
ncbi:hypothetical protein PTTG_00190 [Puccinia triticina 1-1 BBBD Race 1]|uniref:asparagine synthase (glutamine-hydrolyzing) n=1 Tax=Puccinia triticina (isolate 1-1 / race 1 (BBBD)) TaxID=630390 RepID=A0A180G3S7_PUCT1|nr:hypothetical protein PTTG_00190 [Puccinia triticina 1-1 BBBD Race 1]